MSRIDGPVSGESRHACALCGEEIRHDVARIDGGRIYHMSCFSKHVSDGKTELRDCPACQTLGALWNWDHSQWYECDVCNGTGYRPSIVANDTGDGSAMGSAC